MVLDGLAAVEGVSTCSVAILWCDSGLLVTAAQSGRKMVEELGRIDERHGERRCRSHHIVEAVQVNHCLSPCPAYCRQRDWGESTSLSIEAGQKSLGY